VHLATATVAKCTNFQKGLGQFEGPNEFFDSGLDLVSHRANEVEALSCKGSPEI